MNKFMAILWLIVGVAILASGEVTLFQYGCCWVVLMCKYVQDICEEET